ncbi:MAG: DUF2156 domain-containing protein [Actinobacteria bacterium]|nr:MAG: DUF2156 domain-containing protein [Actinomycetota bacterium]
MPLRRPQPATLLALGAAFAGLVSIVSALTPEFADRIDLIRGVLPPGVPEAARVVALALGIALVWLSRSLARRKHRAWQLAVAAVVVSAVAHLAKGLDFEEATISLALLVALVRYRRRFDVPGDPATVRPLLVIGLAAAAAAAIGVGVELHGGTVTDRVGDLFDGIGIVAGFYALFLWLRPLSHVVAQTVGDRRVVRELVDTYGRDSLSFFALRRDRRYAFSQRDNALLAYRVVNGCALVTGDPIGERTELAELLVAFRALARAHAWRVALLGVGGELLDLYR